MKNNNGKNHKGIFALCSLFMGLACFLPSVTLAVGEDITLNGIVLQQPPVKQQMTLPFSLDLGISYSDIINAVSSEIYVGVQGASTYCIYDIYQPEISEIENPFIISNSDFSCFDFENNPIPEKPSDFSDLYLVQVYVSTGGGEEVIWYINFEDNDDPSIFPMFEEETEVLGVSFVPENISQLASALPLSLKTTAGSMLPITALVIFVPLTFWIIIQIMGMFPKEEKKKKGNSHAENMEVIREDWRARGKDLSRLHDVKEK